MAATNQGRKIVKNTIILYIRTLLVMAITLFTSRVVLNALGVDDYGIYNVVGGLVAMFAVLSSSLSNAISRFITYELGHGDKDKLRIIFSSGVNILLGISILIIIVGEVIGIWFLNNKMTIPLDRLYAANWVLQFCLLTFCINLVSVPYNAAIIAHERMSAFAYVSLLDAALTLGVAYLISVSPFDKLITYGFLLMMIKLIIRLIYGIYCKKKFEECSYKYVYDKIIYKEMINFAGWNFFGNTAYLLNTQGVNMLMNVYFGVAVNAARGVAGQVSAAVSMFVGNYMTAVNPQITKSYASGDLNYMHELIAQSSKFSGYLFLFFAVPVVLEADGILFLWLKTVPDYTAIFLRITIISAFLDTVFSSAMVTAVNATGKIKNYQIWMTIFGCSVFPLSWLAFEFGAAPWATYVIYGLVYGFLIFVRLYFLKRMINHNIKKFISNVVLPYIPIVLFAFAIPSILLFVMHDGLLRLLFICFLSVISTGVIVYNIGMNNNEKQLIKTTIDNKIKKYVYRQCIT